jgi:hypothetical protein
VSGLHRRDVLRYPRVPVDQLGLGKGQAGQVHPCTAAPQRERQRQAGVHVEPPARSGDEDAPRRSERGKQRRNGQRERTGVGRQRGGVHHRSMISHAHAIAIQGLAGPLRPATAIGLYACNAIHA